MAPFASGHIVSLIDRAQVRSGAVRERFGKILPPSVEPWHPIPFFGLIDSATALTVAMNPSADEFRGRGWTATLQAPDLAARLTSYFTSEPHSWFGPLESPLRALGLRYGSNLAHVDLVCRATRTITTADRDEFLALADEEAGFFFDTLALAARARVLVLAGSMTNARYAHEHVARHASAFGWTFSPRPRRAPGGPFASTHELQIGTRRLPVLFVSASVNRRDGPRHYQRLVAEHHNWLAERLTD